MERKIFWTSGWDSTFRVLQLLDKQVYVKPYYIIDTGRLSTPTEIKTLNSLRKGIEKLFPRKIQYLGEITYFSVHEIQENREITESWKTLKSESHIGSQYDWLARFASQRNLRELELAVHKDDKVHDFLEQYIIQKDDTFKLAPENIRPEIKKLFGSFSFPVLHWTKLEMDRYSKEKGWTEIMNMTWFCHHPNHGRPCGICNPCRYTIQEGMVKRFSSAAKLRYSLRLGFDGVRFAKKTYNKLVANFTTAY